MHETQNQDQQETETRSRPEWLDVVAELAHDDCEDIDSQAYGLMVPL